VTEGQVIGEDDTTPTVELDEEILDCPAGDPECPLDEDEDDTNETDDNESIVASDPTVTSASTTLPGSA